MKKPQSPWILNGSCRSAKTKMGQEIKGLNVVHAFAFGGTAVMHLLEQTSWPRYVFDVYQSDAVGKRFQFLPSPSQVLNLKVIGL